MRLYSTPSPPALLPPNILTNQPVVLLTIARHGGDHSSTSIPPARSSSFPSPSSSSTITCCRRRLPRGVPFAPAPPLPFPSSLPASPNPLICRLARVCGPWAPADERAGCEGVPGVCAAEGNERGCMGVAAPAASEEVSRGALERGAGLRWLHPVPLVERRRAPSASIQEINLSLR